MIDEFIAILQSHEIENLIDIRRYPSSQRYPQFNKPHLEAGLQIAAIQYIWLGETLGGFRNTDYSQYMDSDAFKSGVSQLIKTALEKRSVMMCAEKLYQHCHRRFISDYLIRDGWSVNHLLDGDTAIGHQGELL